MTTSKFLRRHWHDFGLISTVVAAVYLIADWSQLVALQQLLLLNFIVVLLHQFEEYGWPGGFPAVANIVMLRSDRPDRYPLNQQSSMVANLLFAYVFYLLPVFFPKMIWLGLAPVLVGFPLQFFGHVIIVNKKLKSLYSPGVATAVFGHLPVAAFYIYQICTNHLATGWDWLFAFLYAIGFAALDFGALEVALLGDKNSRYPFDQDEMERMEIGKKFALAQR
ncbi:MAG TPA: HXXEE domain-containing protein [Chthoniobacter sp.]|jgi:hypothetical protein